MRALTTTNRGDGAPPDRLSRRSQIDARAEFDILSYFRARKHWSGFRDTCLNWKTVFSEIHRISIRPQIEKNVHFAPYPLSGSTISEDLPM